VSTKSQLPFCEIDREVDTRKCLVARKLKILGYTARFLVLWRTQALQIRSKPNWEALELGCALGARDSHRAAKFSGGHTVASLE
jgi:hypothetical protein